MSELNFLLMSKEIWGTLARNLNLLLPSNSWNDTLEALINLNGDRYLRFLITLAWQASIYELWRERNNRLHRKVYRSSSAILSSIKAVIKNMISSFRDINSDLSSTTINCGLLQFERDDRCSVKLRAHLLHLFNFS
ncbi:hypothetical protein Bca4012_050526 [Brassica carinata]